MSDLATPIVWIIAFVGVIAFYAGLRIYFAPEALERRRRRRSHGKVISKAGRPTVSLAVDAKPDDDKR